MYQAPHTNSSATSEMNASILNKKKKNLLQKISHYDKIFNYVKEQQFSLLSMTKQKGQYSSS